MATKFVAAVALFALCHANPVLINGILYRDGRAYSMGQATSFGNGVSTAQANVNGDAAQAFGSASNGAGLARDGYYYPGQAIAQAQTYDAPPFPENAYGGAKAVAQAQDGAYYPVPAPATVITYEQNFAPAASSVSHANSHGAGVAQSSANTRGVGGYGVTSSNANTHGEGSADSNANSGYGTISSSAKTHGEASAASSAQSNDAAAAKVVAQTQNGAYYPVPAPATVITYQQNFAPAASSVSHADSHGTGVAQSSANTRGVGGYGGVTSSNANTHGEGSADSNANSGNGAASSSAKTHGEGSAASSAQNNGVVGVVYPAALADQPAAVVDAKSPFFYTSYVPVVPAQGVASSNANVVGSGNAASSAKVGHGQGRTISWRFGTLYDAPASAQAQANTHSGYGAAKSAANTHGYGSANANAGVNGYGSAKSVADRNSGHGVAQSSANSHGAGSANANANVNSAGYGGARSSADVHGQYYGGSRSSADAHSHHFGNAASSARTQGVNTVFRVTNSQANSSGHGSAHANAVSV